MRRAGPLALLAASRAIGPLALLAASRAIGPLALLAASCTIDKSALDDRAFNCDVTDSTSTCGDEYTCYGASGIGSQDFCVPECEGPAESEETVCTADGEELRRCTPGQACDIEGLACMRTDLIDDRGLCLDLTPCTVDADCRDPARNRCASTVFPDLFPDAALRTDNLYCMERCTVVPALDPGAEPPPPTCVGGGFCLSSALGGALFPPICAPPCDSRGRCPPTFTCFARLFPFLELPYCVPGQPGWPCFSNTDCLGLCNEMIPDSLSACATECATDEDCMQLDHEVGSPDGSLPFLYACHEGRCVSPTSLFLNFCLRDEDCPGDYLCYELGNDGISACLGTCDDSESCPALGGLPMSCYAGICWAAGPMAPCDGSDDDCMGELGCSDLLKAAPEVGTAVCLLPCETTEECGENRWLKDEEWRGRQWYCGTELSDASEAHVCVPKMPNGEQCGTEDIVCLSESCQGGTCQPGREIGEECWNSCQCLSASCAAGECAPRDGDSCTTDCDCPCSNCRPGGTCGVCVACESDDDCPCGPCRPNGYCEPCAE